MAFIISTVRHVYKGRLHLRDIKFPTKVQKLSKKFSEPKQNKMGNQVTNKIFSNLFLILQGFRTTINQKRQTLNFSKSVLCPWQGIKLGKIKCFAK